MNDQSADIVIESLVEPWVILRPVNKESVEYLELRDSIADRGFLNSIAVRPSPRDPGQFEIIDGLYRWNCAKEIGLTHIPCIVKHGISDEDVLAIQIQANANRPETTPMEYARQLKRIQKARPDITLVEISHLVHKRPIWVSQMLGLLKLNKSLQKAVDRGDICLANAYMLAKIPDHMQASYSEAAKTMTSHEFRALAAGVIKAFTEAVKQGKMDAFFTADFQAQPHMRSLKDLLDELESPGVGPVLVVSENCKTLLDAWKTALTWVVHLDKQSVQEQEAAARKRCRESYLRETADEDRQV